MPIARLRGPAHPDVLCDTMALALVEAYLLRDPEARTRVSVSAGRESVFVDGDLVTSADFDAAPILKKTMAEVDPLLALEPFITCEAVQPDVLPQAASSDHCVVVGYATAETSDGLPPARSAGRSFSRVLERFRGQEEDGFMLPPDYDILADDARCELLLRVMGVPQDHLTILQPRVQALLESVLPAWSLRFAALHGEGGGLRRSSGRSGVASSADDTTSHLPCMASGVGYVIRHPLNLGRWLAHAATRRLVREERGRGVLLILRWEAGDTRPQLVSARNERGADLSAHVHVADFDLLGAHEAYLSPGLLVAAQRADWDADIQLPWEF